MQPADRDVIPLEDLETSLEDFRPEVAPEAPRASAVPSRPVVKLDTPSAIKALESPSPSKAVVKEAQAGVGVPLAELLSAEVRIESYEAVAIVQALCTSVLERGTRLGAPDPELQSVRIHANGTISAVSSGSHDPAVAIQFLGEVLSRLLPKKDFMFLRERVVQKATSSPPYYTSVEELSDTLGYYERADRTTQIREVYGRWQNRGAAPAVPAPPLRRPIGEVIAETVSSLSPEVRLGAAAVLGLAGLALVGFLVVGSESDEPPVQQQSRSREAVRDLALAADAPPTQAGEPPRATRRPVVPPPAGQAPTRIPAAKQVVTAAPRIAEARTSQGPSNSASSPARADGEPVDRNESRSAIVLPLPPTPPAPQRIRAPEPAVESEQPSAQATIYSVNNSDVIPPAVLFSQLPGPSPLVTPQHDVPALEIVVNERGTVDAVRAVARPRNIAESVVLTNGLSAAKAWRFRPALKDGHPVRYRLIVALGTD